MRPRLLTFDIFGTVLDWRRGLRDSLRRHGEELRDEDFDRVIDCQAGLESESFRSYASIVSSSLTRILGIPHATAKSIGAEAGTWPLYPDSREALRRLRRMAPCVATTNSDASHARQAQGNLGFDLDGWITAEAVRCYKPDPAFWRHAARKRSVPFDRSWWHVSAYADYDLATARRLGLTCVFVGRPHARYGPAHLYVRDLAELAARVEGEAMARRRVASRRA
ncbi:MAG TPA: HAD family hydrolase [Candidatus Polarisedimenticolia bacterium]|nr:HAD family hydrolase [Candidatus Polarisedimenticolia bacterium]